MKQILTILTLSISMTLHAQWYQTVGAGPTSINALIIQNQNIFAGTNGNGFHFSQDSGHTWRSNHLGLASNGSSDPSARIMSMAMIHDTLYAGVYAQGMFYYSNTLKRWKTINTGVGSSSTFHSILNLNDTVILIAGSAMLRSSNGGLNWKPSGTGLTTSTYKLLKRGNIIYTVGYNGGGVFKSTDWGYTWSKADSGLKSSQSDVPYLSEMVQTSNAIYAGVTNNAERSIYKLADGSPVWVLCKNGYTNNGAPTALLAVNDSLFAGCSEGMYKSADGGNNWVKSNTGLITYTPVQSLATNGTDIYLGGATNAPGSHAYIYKSTDFGKTWKRVTSQLARYTPNTIFADGNNIYMGIGASGFNEGGIYRSNDLGVTWPRTKMPGLDINVSAIHKMGNRLFAGGTSSNGVGQKLYTWTDTSTMWIQPANTGLYQYTKVLCFASKNDSLFIGIADAGSGGPDGGVYVSADFGANWTRVSTGIPGDDVNGITTIGGELYISTRSVMRSSDNGATWVGANGNLPTGYQAEKIFSIGDTLVVASTSSSPYYSTDKGQTWVNMATATYPTGSDGHLRGIAFQNGRWFVATNSKGVWVTDDHATTWKSFNEGLASFPSTYTIAVSNGKVFAGAFVRSASGSDSIQLPVFTGLFNKLSETRDLLVYPNPCNEKVTIEAAFPVQRVLVFDMNGRVVIHESGISQSKLEVNTTQLQQGVYFLRAMDDEGGLITRKFIKE